jgi:endoglucanase
MPNHRSRSLHRSALSLSLLGLLAACSGYSEVERPAELKTPLTTSGLFYQGNNFSGAERGFGSALEESWGPAIPGVEDETYWWPTPTANTLPPGMNIVRLPFQWERVQPVLSQELDPAYLAKLRATANAWRDLGANVLLDVHNYAYYKVNGRGTTEPGQHIGSAEVPIGAFADLWRRLAHEFGSTSTSAPFIFGLMNEPHDIEVETWVEAAQAAVDAIRAAGAKNTIFVPGADWTTANDFSWSSNRTLLQTVHDPLDNFAIEVHQYYDGVCTPDGYVEKLKPFEDWAVANQRQAYLGELDVHETEVCHEAFAKLIDHLHARAAGKPNGVWIGYSYWQGPDVAKGLPYIQPHLPATCTSGVKDGLETDRDCGQTCLRCKDAQSCAQDYDCQSGFCTNGLCSAAVGGGGSGGGGGGGGAGSSGGAGAAGSGGSAIAGMPNSGGNPGGGTAGATGGLAGSVASGAGGASVGGGSDGANGNGATATDSACSCRNAGAGRHNSGSWLALAALLGLVVKRRRDGLAPRASA